MLDLPFFCFTQRYKDNKETKLLCACFVDFWFEIGKHGKSSIAVQPSRRVTQRCSIKEQKPVQKTYSTVDLLTNDPMTIFYHPSIHANISGATMVASLSTMNFGVLMSSLPQVIFSLGTAPL